MNGLILTTLFAVGLSLDIVLRHNEERTLYWPISPAQNLLIDCESNAASNHYFTLKVFAVGFEGQTVPLTERLVPEGRSRIHMTVPHPQSSNLIASAVQNFNQYLVVLACQSHSQHDEHVWNLVSLQLHSNFDHILQKNEDPRLSEDQKQYAKIEQNAELIYRLAEEHAQVQLQKRQEEDVADQSMESLNTKVVWYTIFELVVILGTIIAELLCLRSFLHKHKVI